VLILWNKDLLYFNEVRLAFTFLLRRCFNISLFSMRVYCGESSITNLAWTGGQTWKCAIWTWSLTKWPEIE